jgi:hypothetical protein
MHLGRARGSLGVEVLDVMKKGKWIFDLRNQSSHEESHISKCQSLLNQVSSDLETKSENWSYGSKYPKSPPLRVNAKTRSHVASLMKSKRSEVTIINIVQAQVHEIYFIFRFGLQQLVFKFRMFRIPKSGVPVFTN